MSKIADAVEAHRRHLALKYGRNETESMAERLQEQERRQRLLQTCDAINESFENWRKLYEPPGIG